MKLGVKPKTKKDDSDEKEIIDLQLIPSEHTAATKLRFKEKVIFAFTFYAVTVGPRTWPLRPFFGRRNWWNEVISGLILGAIPVIEYGHKQELSHYFSHTGRPLKRIVSCCTHAELKGEGLGVTPIPPSYWAEQGIKQDHLNMADFTGMINSKGAAVLTQAAQELRCLEHIHQSILNMKEDLDAGGSVYVHCKAGRGRSVLDVVCYLIYFLDMLPQEAIDFVSSKRPEISLSCAQIDFIFKYCNQYRADLLTISGDDNLALMPYQENTEQKVSWIDTMMQYILSIVSKRLTSDFRVLHINSSQENDMNLQALMRTLSTSQARALHAGLTDKPLDMKTYINQFPILDAGQQARKQQLEHAKDMGDTLAKALGTLNISNSNAQKPKAAAQ